MLLHLPVQHWRSLCFLGLSQIDLICGTTGLIVSVDCFQMTPLLHQIFNHIFQWSLLLRMLRRLHLFHILLDFYLLWRGKNWRISAWIQIFKSWLDTLRARNCIDSLIMTACSISSHSWALLLACRHHIWQILRCKLIQLAVVLMVMSACGSDYLRWLHLFVQEILIYASSRFTSRSN